MDNNQRYFIFFIGFIAGILYVFVPIIVSHFSYLFYL